jgi:hypothetical protein
LVLRNTVVRMRRRGGAASLAGRTAARERGAARERSFSLNAPLKFARSGGRLGAANGERRH